MKSERSQNFRYKVTAVFVRGLFSEGVAKGSRRQQMRCRLILLISEHPIQQGIRKGGVRHFCDGRTDEDGRTDRMAYSKQLDYSDNDDNDYVDNDSNDNYCKDDVYMY